MTQELLTIQVREALEHQDDYTTHDVVRPDDDDIIFWRSDDPSCPHPTIIDIDGNREEIAINVWDGNAWCEGSIIYLNTTRQFLLRVWSERDGYHVTFSSAWVKKKPLSGYASFFYGRGEAECIAQKVMKGHPPVRNKYPGIPKNENE